MSNVVEFSIKAVDDFSAAFGKLNAGLGGLQTAFTAVAAAYPIYKAIEMTKASLDNAEAMWFAAQRAETSTEAFSAMAFAAKLSNVDVSTLSQAYKFLGQAIAEESKNAMTPAAAELKALGITAKDPTEAMLQLADAFSTSKNTVDKTAIAMELFKRGGTSIVPFLNQGSEAIKAMMQDAKDLGQVIGSDFGASANQINDNLQRMSALMTGSVNKALAKLAPIIEELTGDYILWNKEADNVNNTAEIIAIAMKSLVTVGTALSMVWTSLIAVGKDLVSIEYALYQAMTGDLAGAHQTLITMGHDEKKVNDDLAKSAQHLADMWSGKTVSAAAEVAKKLSDLQAKEKALKLAGEELAKEHKDMIDADKAWSDSMNKIIRDMQISAETAGMTADQMIIYKLATEGADEALVQIAVDIAGARDAQKNQMTVMENFTAMLDEQQIQLGTVSKQVAGVMFDAFNSLKKGIGDAVGNAIVYGGSLKDSMESLAKQIIASMISAFIQIGVQRIVLQTLTTTAYTNEAAASSAAAAVEIANASAVATASTAAAASVAAAWTAAGVAMMGVAGIGAGMVSRIGERIGGGSGTIGGTIGGFITGGPVGETISSIGSALGFAGGGYTGDGSRSGGLDGQGGFMAMLHPQESVIDHAMGQGGSIQNVTIHVLENATNVDAFRSMDKVALRNALGQPIIDALNEMFTIGVRPDFAKVNR